MRLFSYMLSGFLLYAVALGAEVKNDHALGASEPAEYVRFVEDKDGAKLETAIGRFVSPEGVVVDLVGAIHIADKSYYEELNRRFKQYDAVLYELVGRSVKERLQEDKDKAAGEKGKLKTGDDDNRLRWLGQLQEGMRKTLELESQLSGIDYLAPNFVHADMSLESFFASQERKKESFLGLWWKMVKNQGGGPDIPQPGLGKILEVLCQKDNATELKRLVGRQFEGVKQVMTGIESEGGSAIVGERNRHALSIFEREVRAGKKRVAIFYGAAHLPDMESRLLQAGYKQSPPLEWLAAWSLPPEPTPETKQPARPVVAKPDSTGGHRPKEIEPEPRGKEPQGQ